MGARKQPLVRNRDLALYLGVGAWVLGLVLLKDAYDNRGKSKPLPLRIVGAVL